MKKLSIAARLWIPTIALGVAMALMTVASASRTSGLQAAAKLVQERQQSKFELALRWLRERLPGDPVRPQLVHGDFRNGNLIVGPEGVRAVIDWEIAHLGDPAEDLAWICLPPWRFGQIDRPVGGLGARADLFDAHAAATGQPVEVDRVDFWQVMGSLRWGIGCAGMLDWFASGRDPTVERAMIARRVSENELDLMRFFAGRT